MAQVTVPTNLTLDELLACLAPTISRDSYFTSEEWADYLHVGKDRMRHILHLAAKAHRLASARDCRTSDLTGQTYSTWVYQISAS